MNIKQIISCRFSCSNKILFYYPQHFNRSENGTNPFFEPLLRACDKAGIPYDVFEEPDNYAGKPRNKSAKSAKIFFWTIIVIRKIVKVIFPKRMFWVQEEITARIFNVLSLGSWRYRKYVSISGSMEELFLAINSKAEVYELQHGVDYSEKSSYFDKGSLKVAYQSRRWHLMSWGEGYRLCVIRGHAEDYNLADRVHVVGYPMYREISNDVVENRRMREKFTILFSLQFTNDWSMETLSRYKDVVISTLHQLENIDCEVLLKHHPRYNSCIDLSDVYKRFPFVHETKEMLSDLQNKTDLHVTLNSTTGFEFAEVGIPSYFLNGSDFPQDESLYYREYGYPLYKGFSIREVVERLHNDEARKQDAEVVMKWYKIFYSPFDEEMFVELMSR